MAAGVPWRGCYTAGHSHLRRTWQQPWHSMTVCSHLDVFTHCVPLSPRHTPGPGTSQYPLWVLCTPTYNSYLTAQLKFWTADASSSWTVGRMHPRRVKNWKTKPLESAASLWKNGFTWTHQVFPATHFKCIKQSFLQIHIFPPHWKQK